MLFLEQLRGELRMLFARPRTWMGYGAFLIMEALILFVYKLERSQNHMRGLIERNGPEFGAYYSSLAITFTIMLLSMFLLGSSYFALAAGAALGGGHRLEHDYAFVDRLHVFLFQDQARGGDDRHAHHLFYHPFVDMILQGFPFCKPYES